MRFNDKIALVTGAASGIGLAVTQRLAAEGATVIATDINEHNLRALSDNTAERVITKLSNAASTSDIAELAVWTEAEFDRVDVLVNNAGFALLSGPEELDEAEYRAQIDVLLTGPVFFVKHFAKLLRNSRNGSVVNISSASALLSSPGYCPYALAKAAIHKFSEDCVIQVPGIRHNTIMPGFIDTPILSAYGDEGTINQMKALVAKVVPIKRMGEPNDIAHSVLFLASDEAVYINGAGIVVDGGLSRLNTAISLLDGSVSLT